MRLGSCYLVYLQQRRPKNETHSMFWVMHSKWIAPQNLGISNSERKILSNSGRAWACPARRRRRTRALPGTGAAQRGGPPLPPRVRRRRRPWRARWRRPGGARPWRGHRGSSPPAAMWEFDPGRQQLPASRLAAAAAWASLTVAQTWGSSTPAPWESSTPAA